MSASQTAIYPNPAGDFLNVSAEGNALLTLYTLDGLTVKSVACRVGANRINISELSQGIYLGILKVNDTTERYKIIKN